MKPTGLWIAAALLFVATLAILFVWLPSRTAPVVRQGVRADGQVASKDSRPLGDGSTHYYLRLIYIDANRVNHDAEVEVDQGTWGSLKTGQDVKVRYMPAKPSEAYVDGAIVPGAAPGTGLKALALTTFVAALVCAYLAYTGAHPPQAGQPARPAHP